MQYNLKFPFPPIFAALIKLETKDRHFGCRQSSFLVRFRDVAQPGSAHVWGAWGRKFKSCHPDKSIKLAFQLIKRLEAFLCHETYYCKEFQLFLFPDYSYPSFLFPIFTSHPNIAAVKNMIRL